MNENDRAEGFAPADEIKEVEAQTPETGFVPAEGCAGQESPVQDIPAMAEDVPADAPADIPDDTPDGAVEEAVSEPAAQPIQEQNAGAPDRPYAPPYAPFEPFPPRYAQPPQDQAPQYQPPQYQPPQYQPPQYRGYQPQNAQPQQYYQGYTQPAAPYYPPQPQPQAPVQPQAPDMNANPYLQYEAPQSAYDQQGYAQPYGQYGQPYGQYGQPYGRPYAKPERPRTSTGTKVFLIILIGMVAALIIGFIVYVSGLANSNKNNNDNDRGGFSVPEIINELPDSGSNDIGLNSSGEEFDEEISLVPDEGDTQKREGDKAENSADPDANAKLIELKALPSDKSNSKYTTQSAYDAICDSVVTVELYDGEITENVLDIKGQGTGTIISADGYIITNAHVIGNSRYYTIKIVMNSGEEYPAKVVGYDTWTDLALLKVDAKGLKPVVFGDSGLIEIGQDVVAIGSPGGEKFQNSLTKGIVSAVGRELSINKYVKYIQSDAAISPGNSGGPLCNIYGQVIGINTAKTVATNYEAMTFSIPSDTVRDIVNDLLRYGYVKNRARIGFSGNEVSTEEQYYYGYPSGLIIGEIDQSGALAGTKIKEGDVITAIDGVEVSTFQDVYAILNQHKPGDKVKISVYRPAQ